MLLQEQMLELNSHSVELETHSSNSIPENSNIQVSFCPVKKHIHHLPYTCKSHHMRL